MLKSPGDIAFQIGTFDIHWYGIIMSFSMLCALFVILFLRKKFFKDITTDNIFDLSFEVIISGIVFARLYYVLLDLDYFIQKPYEIVQIWNGGISIQGAIIGGIIAGYLYCKENKCNFFVCI
jgi:phosphatidylglycerol:prolipoprotein diacylglycerol transferase